MWVREEIAKRIHDHPEIITVVVDSIRVASQIDAIRESFGSKVIHVHLTAPQTELAKRYKQRQKSKRESTRTYAEAHDDPTEKQVETLSEIADVVINAKRCTSTDVLMRVASHLNIRRGKGRGYVDVLVGGEYGSEGKGHIAAYLAQEYDLLVRVGGPNAGHKVYEEPDPYTHHQLPSGTRRNEEAHLAIGPGATVRVDKLLDEIADCKVNADRLSIDPKVMIISNSDKDSEVEGVKTIGSTGQGVGSAMARRILGRFDSPPPLMARDVPELRPFLGDTLKVLEHAYANDSRIFLEGTQGTALSLYHGSYPHVTSRDTTVSGCLAESGIAWNRIRKVIMICRTYPIRVQNAERGTSGPMSQEITWAEISRRSGISRATLEKSELTSTTYKKRRVSEFDWDLLYRSSLINGTTDIALTFTDYLSKKNSTAKRFEQLQPDTINFIQEVERVSGARVSLISTGFNYRSIIDRRSW